MENKKKEFYKVGLNGKTRKITENEKKEIELIEKEKDVIKIHKDSGKLLDFEADSMEIELMIKRDNLKKKYGFDITIADFLKELRFLAKSDVRINIFFILSNSWFQKTYCTFNTILNQMEVENLTSRKLSYHLNEFIKAEMIKKVSLYQNGTTKPYHTFYRLKERIAYLSFLLFEWLNDNEAQKWNTKIDILERPDILIDLAIKMSEIIIQNRDNYDNVVLLTYTEVHKNFLEYKKESNLTDILQKKLVKQIGNKSNQIESEAIKRKIKKMRLKK